jgi:hypothetical protein
MSASCPTCHHVLPTSKRCGSPALRGEQFCFYHHPTRRPPTRVMPSRIPFDVEAITDPEALQIALSEVIRRLAGNTLDLKRASLLLISLQLAKANLAALPRYPFGEPFTRESPSNTARSAAMDFADQSGLLAIAGLQPTPSVRGH